MTLLTAMSFFIGSCCSRQSTGTGYVARKTEPDPPVKFIGYFIGGELNQFKDSNGAQYYQVEGEIDELESKYAALISVENEPVYVELMGSLSPGDADNESSPAKTLYITELIKIDYISRDLKLFPMDFRCFGNEPFWSIDILTDDELIFRDLSQTRCLYIPYAEPVIENGVWTYTLTFEDNEVILKITDGECFDSMSGQKYEFSAQFEIMGDVFTGCAEKIDGD